MPECRIAYVLVLFLPDVERRRYCARVGVDRAAFDADRALKEAHRGALTDMYDVAVAADAHAFARRVVDAVRRLVASDVGIVIVEDLRRTADWAYMCLEGCGVGGGAWLPGLASVRFMRVTCSLSVRRARGWVEGAYDAHACECEMDGVAAGSEFDNSGSAGAMACSAAAVCEVYADTDVAP